MKTEIALKTQSSIGVLLMQQIFLGTCYVVSVIGVGAAIILAVIGLVVPATAVPGSVLALGSTNSITLTWTAPGDDNTTGLANQYDIRYSTAPITAENFSSAVVVLNPPQPSIAGTSETFEVTGLTPDTLYYFALKTADEVPNWSEVSNITSKRTAAPELCEPSWSCTAWSGCLNSLKTRICLDINNCDMDEGKPDEQIACTTPILTCIENWSCGSWGVCQNNLQSRTCADLNECGTENSKPEIQKSCTVPAPACSETWSCTTWSACQDSRQTRTCLDANNCGTILNKPAVQRTCVMPVCQEDWSCTAWSECDGEFINRACLDVNDCGAEDDKPEIKISCAMGGGGEIDDRQRLLAVTPSSHGGPHLRLYDENFNLYAQFFTYDPSFRNGVNTAIGDTNGDGQPEIITGTGPGSAPHIRVFDPKGNLKHQFYAYPESFRIGVTVAAGDINGDGRDEIIVAPQEGGGPHIRIITFDPKQNKFVLYKDFFAYPQHFRMGLNLAAADLNNNGLAEIIVAPRVQGGPHLRIFEYHPYTRNFSLKSQFFAYAFSFRGGVSLATGDIDNDGIKEIITGAGPGGGPHVRVFDHQGNFKTQFFAASTSFRGGVDIAAFDYDRDGADEIITGAWSNGQPGVFAFDYDWKNNSFSQTHSFYAYDPLYIWGIRLAGK